MTLSRIAAEVTKDQWVSSPGVRPAPELHRALLGSSSEPGAWAWIEVQPDNDQTGLRPAVIQ